VADGWMAAALAMALLAVAGCAQPAAERTGSASADPGTTDLTSATTTVATPQASSSHASSSSSSPPSSTTTGSSTSSSPPPAPTPDGGRPALVAPTARPEVYLGTVGAAEPDVVVAPHGHVYVYTPISLWRSGDAGRTFQAAPASGLEGSGDGSLAVDGNGTLYSAGLFGASSNVPFQVSRDAGSSFSTPAEIGPAAFDREWIDATPAGHLYTTWRDNAGIATRVSLDQGATWQSMVVAAPDADAGSIAHDPRPASHALYLPMVGFASVVGSSVPVTVARSLDEGRTWSVSQVASIPQGPVEANGYASDFPVAAVDGAGTVYVVFSAQRGLPASVPEAVATFGVFLSVSHDQGATWSTPTLLSPTDKVARFPWVTAGAAGRVAVGWYENVLGLPNEFLPDEWNVMLTESVTADAATPVWATLPLTSSPSHVGSICTMGGTCTVNDRSLLDFFQIAIGEDGQPVAAWASSTAGTGLGSPFGTDVYFGGVAQGTPLW